MKGSVERSVVPLSESQIPGASRLLGRAFQNDSLAAYMFPDPGEKKELLPIHFEAIVRYGFLAEKAWTTAGNEGVVICQPPGHVEMDAEAMAKSGIMNLGARVGQGAADRFENVTKHMEPLRFRDAGSRHWYVMVLGVDPSKKGTGVGSTLLKHVSSLADLEQVPTYLETGQPENVLFYRNNGFTVVVADIEPASGLRFWTLKREPRPKPAYP
jgi:GNAT superfamily N-acetyltransferase